MGKIKLIHEELSFKVRGVLYEVHNELGQYRNEKQYGDAIEFSLKKLVIPYKREVILSASFNGEKPGRNRVDFVIDDRIILEIKAVPSFSRKDYAQCMRYLASTSLELALLVNFNLKSCVIKRILNPNLLKPQPSSVHPGYP